MNLWMRVKIEPHIAPFVDPEDHYEEFVRDVSITLYHHPTVAEDDMRCDPEAEESVVAEIEGLIIRQTDPSNAGIDVWDMADAHSVDASAACGYLQRIGEEDKNDSEFYGQFSTLPDCSEVFLAEDLEWSAEWTHIRTPEMVRQLLRRAIDQLDVDLVLIGREESSFSKYFEGFFECFKKDEGAPFLIYSKAMRWPSERRQDPEPQVTSPGGAA